MEETTFKHTDVDGDVVRLIDQGDRAVLSNERHDGPVVAVALYGPDLRRLRDAINTCLGAADGAAAPNVLDRLMTSAVKARENAHNPYDVATLELIRKVIRDA